MARRRSQIDFCEGILTSISQSLVPLQDAEKEAEKKAQEIYEVVQTHFETHEVVRFHLAGSIQTWSSTWILPEFCCVIFINIDHVVSKWKKPEMVTRVDEKIAQISEEWREILLKNNILTSVEAENLVAQGPQGLKVAIRVGIDATKFAAIDFKLPPECRSVNGSSTPWHQTSGLLELFKRLSSEKDRIDFGNTQLKHSFAELNSVWLSRQSYLSHQLIRLAKLWTMSCCPSEMDIGTKMRILESIAIEASSQVAPEYPYKLMGAFKKFLGILVDNQAYKKIQIKNVAEFTGKYSFTKPEEGSAFITDPCNPHNNLLEGVSDEETVNFNQFLTICAKQAKLSSEELDNFVKNNGSVAEVFLVERNLEIHGIENPKHMLFEVDEEHCFFSLVQKSSLEPFETQRLAIAVACMYALVPRSVNASDELVADLAEMVNKYMKIRTSSLFADRSIPEVTVKVPLSETSSVLISCGVEP